MTNPEVELVAKIDEAYQQHEQTNEAWKLREINQAWEEESGARDVEEQNEQQAL